LYFTQKQYEIDDESLWWPGFIIRQLVASDMFRAATNVTFGFLPWVLCRQTNSFATVFNFVNHWITLDTVTLNDYGVFCYRLYMLLGDAIFDSNDIYATDFPFGPQKVLMTFFNQSVEEELDGNNSARKPCSSVTKILRGSPVIKHDIEICNHWSRSCGDCLEERFNQLYLALLKYGVEAGNQIYYDDMFSCVVYNGAVCDMIRSLRALAILVTPASQRSFGNPELTNNTAGACAFTRWLVMSMHDAPHATELLYNFQLENCRTYLPFDWLYWDYP
jgi:hypothetical protein